MRKIVSTTVVGTPYYKENCRASFGKRIHNKDFGEFSVKLVKRSSNKTDYAIEVRYSNNLIGHVADKEAKDLAGKIIFPINAKAKVSGYWSGNKDSTDYKWRINISFSYEKLN